MTEPTNAAQAQADELAVLFPEPVVLQIAGKEISVRPLTIRQVGRVAKAIAPIVAGMNGGEVNFGRMLADHTDDAIAVVAAATGEAPEWLGDLPAEEFLRLAKAAFEVNKQAFIDRIGPAVGGLMRAFAAIPPTGNGQTSSAS